jgi:hypothetical protein
MNSCWPGQVAGPTLWVPHTWSEQRHARSRVAGIPEHPE